MPLALAPVLLAVGLTWVTITIHEAAPESLWTSPVVLTVGVTVVMVSFAIYLHWAAGGSHRLSRSKRLLKQWAAGNGYRIDSAELLGPPLSPSPRVARPFAYRLAGAPSIWNEWTTSYLQSIYRFEAANLGGESRVGWARVGGMFLGLLVNKVDVVWDDEVLTRTSGEFPYVVGGPGSGAR